MNERHFTPTIRDLFYALTLQEIEAQPDLDEELGRTRSAALALRAFGLPVGLLIASAMNSPQDHLTGAGFGLSRQLGPSPTSLRRDAARVIADEPESSYDVLCRDALLHMVWGELDEAEDKINAAKVHLDERAFAHHVYGLLRGLQGDRRGARFELHLAHEREAIMDPLERVEQALRVLDWVDPDA